MGLNVAKMSTTSSYGELHASYDRSVKIMSISNPLAREWAYSINFDNYVIIDLDAQGWIMNIDLLVKPRLNDQLAIPNLAQHGGVQFHVPLATERFVATPIAFETNQTRRIVRVTFGPMLDLTQQTQSIKTSEQVYLQIQHVQLRAILVDFGQKGLWD
ncbi:hypothetical protein [Herpetosiphon llansteffanensis]|uniref:hypothetical protein n=1 Tax=Herpetosiphon llansteffanensis TaxID=2094568 RepID=UPI000D7BC088|nr:hypothetical protein [Herpetosiphon llansteffanensis]